MGVPLPKHLAARDRPQSKKVNRVLQQQFELVNASDRDQSVRTESSTLLPGLIRQLANMAQSQASHHLLLLARRAASAALQQQGNAGALSFLQSAAARCGRRGDHSARHRSDNSSKSQIISAGGKPPTQFCAQAACATPCLTPFSTTQHTNNTQAMQQLGAAVRSVAAEGCGGSEWSVATAAARLQQRLRHQHAHQAPRECGDNRAR